MKDDCHDDRKPAAANAGTSNAGVVARELAPNPQGKGLVGFLQDWDYSSPRGIVPKTSGRILADYFTALLVLSSEFKFKPAFGQTCYLYLQRSRWLLSLVSPDEWDRAEKRRAFVGACVLHGDSTWSIEPSANLGRPGPVSDALAEVYDGFLDRLRCKAPLEDELPVYEGRLPYYQRLFAAALSRSLRGSLAAGGQTGRPSEEWLASLPRDARRLLGSAPQVTAADVPPKVRHQDDGTSAHRTQTQPDSGTGAVCASKWGRTGTGDHRAGPGPT